jgi:hypothetical protein
MSYKGKYSRISPETSHRDYRSYYVSVITKTKKISKTKRSCNQETGGTRKTKRKEFYAKTSR